METFLIFVSIVLVCLFFGGFVYFHKLFKELLHSVESISRQLERLEVQVAVQEREIAEVRKTLQTTLNEPVIDLVSIIGQFKKKGLIPGFVSLGTALFRTYSKKGRPAKALPSRPNEKE